ncbi:hypothetical protein K435DRAFT_810098 [Dendrothele bispora CBS 962.96]|uniref:DUF6534 domain-containing protein n=1 Tax=Dendrothele bispora (strain CBS 962.96) TaxID=1314807 RepID=A0A4S8KW39_DENBC|nr:hypothetical protein K435DRAFT_810098 [Dendrothele bispora CBS 962.96]
MSPTVEKTFGPQLIGVLFNAILFGVLAVQTHIYFNGNRSGERWTRYLVIVLLVLETINTGMDFAKVYEGLFKNSVIAAVRLFCSISTPVQIYYAWRIRILTESNVLAGFIVALALITFASSICATVFGGFHPVRDSFDKSVYSSLVTWMATTAATHKKHMMAVMKSVVDKIIILTIQTGVLTSVNAVASIVIFTSTNETQIAFIWNSSISKLYTNSLVSMLNAREEWNKTLNGQNDAESVSNILFANRDGPADSEQSSESRQ